MYIYDNVVILSSMWCVLRFEHAHGLKRYNDGRMTRSLTTCSLGGTASLGLLLKFFNLFYSYNFYCRFPENDCSFDGLLTLLGNQVVIRRALWKPLLFFCFSLLSQHLLLCHVMKMCHVCYYNNSDATFRLLMSGDINPNPWPVSASTAGKINCLVMNAIPVDNFIRTWQGKWMNRFFPHDVFWRLASLKVDVIILLLKCSYCLQHGIFLDKMAEKERERDKKTKTKKKKQKKRLTAVPLDTLPERCTMTMHHEISARGSLMPAGGGSRCSVRYLVPRQDSEGGKSRPLDHMRQIPFVLALPPLLT